MPTYKVACPICRKTGTYESDFMSSGHALIINGEEYSPLHCGGHTLAEIRKALGMRIYSDEDPNFTPAPNPKIKWDGK